MREKTCCLTGHRELPWGTFTLKQRLIRAVTGRVEAGICYFGVGGAVGFDMLAAEVLMELRDTRFPQIRVIVVEPFEGYTSHWTEDQCARRQELLPRYDKRVCLSSMDSRAAYLARDRYLVDHSAHCICYCNQATGGTAYTVRYALRKGLSVENLGHLDVTAATFL